jgi:hypothetical protein
MRWLKYRLAGVALLVISGLDWAWMFGWLPDIASLNRDDPLWVSWFTPHFGGFTFIVAVFAGLIGLALLLGVIGPARTPK